MDAEELRLWKQCSILHVDMDAFFVSVELRDRPDLVGRQVIVGYPGERSVVLSASYEARRLGVRSAMPMTQAVMRAPGAIVIHPRHSLYYEVSRDLMQIFDSFTHLVEPLSVDEAFLDVSGALRRLGSPPEIASLIRSTVKSELGVTASVGVAPNKFLAKMASTRSKPDGLLVLRPEDVRGFLDPLPVRALWGVGEKFAAQLARLGLNTVADVAAMPEASLRQSFGQMGEHIAALAHGRDSREVTPDHVEKSMSAEHTFMADTRNRSEVEQHLLGLSVRVAERLRKAGSTASGVGLKLRYADFTTLTRSRKLTHPTDSSRTLYQEALVLLDALGPLPMAVRLIGVKADRLDQDQGMLQMSITGDEENWRLAEQSSDALRVRFGSAAVRPARLINARGKREGAEGERTV